MRVRPGVRVHNSVFAFLYEQTVGHGAPNQTQALRPADDASPRATDTASTRLPLQVRNASERVAAYVRVLFAPCALLVLPVLQAAAYGAYSTTSFLLSSIDTAADSNNTFNQIYIVLSVFATQLVWLYLTSPYIHKLNQMLRMLGLLCETAVVLVALRLALLSDRVTPEEQDTAGVLLLVFGALGVVLPLSYHAIITMLQVRVFWQPFRWKVRSLRKRALQVRAMQD